MGKIGIRLIEWFMYRRNLEPARNRGLPACVQIPTTIVLVVKRGLEACGYVPKTAMGLP
jgi:hypothetical protein